MTQLKYYDSTSASWVTAVVGAQGPQGAGNNVSMLEGLFASNWGHSFTNNMAPTTAYPPGPNQETWPYRVANRMGTQNMATGAAGAKIRNGGWPGTNTATDAQLMITGYSTSSLKYTDSYTIEVPSHYIFNPGRGYIDNSTTVSTSGLGATLYNGAGDPGFLMFQCAVNETLGGGEALSTGATESVSNNVQVSSSGTTVTLQPISVNINSGSNQLTIVSGPVPNAGQLIYIAGAGSAGGCLTARVSSVDVSSSILQLDTSASTSVTNAKCWTQIYQYDKLIIGSTSATLTVPTTPFAATGGTIVFHYGAASQIVAYNATPATVASALTLLIQQQPGLSTADVTYSGSSLASCTFSFYADAGHGVALSVGDLWADFTLLTSANGCPGGCTWVLNGTSVYVTSATPTMSSATSSSTFTVTTNTSLTSATVGAAQKFGQWYGAPSSVYGSVYTGWRDAWKNSLRTMLRWARADISTATASGGYYSGINKTGAESPVHRTDGVTSFSVTNVSTIGGTSYPGGGNWPSNQVIYIGATTGLSIGQKVVLSIGNPTTSYMIATILAVGAPSPGSGLAIGIDAAYPNNTFLSYNFTLDAYSWIPTSSSLATLFPQAANTNFAPGAISPSTPWATTSPGPGTLRNSQNNTASYAIQVRDKQSTGEAVVLYPAYPNLQSDTGETANTGGTFTVAGSSSTTVTQVSGYPFSKTRVIIASPVWTMQSALVNVTVGGNSTVTISKASGGTNIVEFDSVFTTTNIPPWCVLACEYAPPSGSLLYRNRGFNDLQQGYMDVAAEAEFAWYVSVIPPITTLINTDLNPSGSSFSLHPNNLGEQKWATYIQSWLANNAYTYWRGPLPAARPYNGNSTTPLGSRMGYY